MGYDDLSGPSSGHSNDPRTEDEDIELLEEWAEGLNDE